MAEKKKRQSWFKRATRVVGMHPHTYEEYWRIRINRIQLISIIILLVVILFSFNYLIFAYTPLGHLLPENIKNRNKQKIEAALNRVVNLENQLQSQEIYISNLQRVILGDISIDSVYFIQDSVNLSDIPPIEVDTTVTEAEKELEQNINERTGSIKPKESETIKRLMLYDPVEGKISQRFRPEHPGVDIVTSKDAPIKACLDGWVIYSGYSDQDGYTIIISHENDILSVYKHAKTIYVKAGEKVKTGQAIGIVGNTGERTTGPHLHFELWSDVGSLNPMNYFSFGR